MIIGVCTIGISLPADSLKAKRRIIKSVITRLRNQFNISVAEVDHLDSWQSAILAAVAVSNDRDYVHGLLMRMIQWIEETRLDCELVDYTIELIS
jgi:hypothetical protein